MTEATNPDEAPKTIRLDPSPSKVFSWLEWREEAEAAFDDRGRMVRPAGSLLLVHFRTSGIEWEHWPCSREEAIAVMNPGALYDYSIGRAYGSVIKAHKSGRPINLGQRQSTVKQREQAEQQAGRRWLA